MPMDRPQRVDENHCVICLVIIPTPGVMVIKMQRWPIVCSFCSR